MPSACGGGSRRQPRGGGSRRQPRGGGPRRQPQGGGPPHSTPHGNALGREGLAVGGDVGAQPEGALEVEAGALVLAEPALAQP